MRQMAAFRLRLTEDAALAVLVGDRVYPTHIVDVAEPVYPCITLFQAEGNQAVWLPRTFDFGVMLVQIYSKVDLQECYDIYELVTQLLHEQKTAVSRAGACFHQIREIWSNSGLWIREDSVWQQSARYLFRVSVT